MISNQILLILLFTYWRIPCTVYNHWLLKASSVPRLLKLRTSTLVSTWMGDHQGRISLCNFLILLILLVNWWTLHSHFDLFNIIHCYWWSVVLMCRWAANLFYIIHCHWWSLVPMCQSVDSLFTFLYFLLRTLILSLLFVVAWVCSLYRMQLYVLYVPRWLSSNAWASNLPW